MLDWVKCWWQRFDLYALWMICLLSLFLFVLLDCQCFTFVRYCSELSSSDCTSFPCKKVERKKGVGFVVTITYQLGQENNSHWWLGSKKILFIVHGNTFLTISRKHPEEGLETTVYTLCTWAPSPINTILFSLNKKRLRNYCKPSGQALLLRYPFWEILRLMFCVSPVCLVCKFGYSVTVLTFG